MAETVIDNRVLLILLSSIGLIVLPHATHIPVPLFAFFCCLLIWRFISIPYKYLLPGNIGIFLFTIVAIILLVSQHQGIWGRDAGTGLFVTALGLKLLEIKKDRDLYLVTYLAFFVAATQFLYIQNILMAVYIFVVCCLLLCTLIFINSQQPNIMASLKISATIILQAIPLMIVIFLFFPRLETPRWAFLDRPQANLSGLSDSLEPGSLTNLALSDQIAFRVTFKDKIPPHKQRYWRGPVLSHTDGKRWTHAPFTRPDYQPEKPAFFGEAYRYKILLEPQTHNWVYALDMPTGFSNPVSQKADYHLESSKNPNERAEYKLTSYPRYKTRRLLRKEKNINLQLPQQASQKIIDFVSTKGGFEQKPRKFIRNVLNHFRYSDFYYTLHPPLYPDKPIETFLFDARLGFCSHYATAFVYLMRVAGIPARVVTGYQGGELNSVGNFLEIRQANAHAWSEIWLPEQGWLRVDPTAAIAPERVEQDVNIAQQLQTGEVNFTLVNLQENFSWLKQAKSMWGNLDYSWQRWVINYSGGTQSGLLSALGIDNIKSWGLWLLSLIVGCTVLLAIFLFRKQTPPVDKALLIYRRFCKKLAKTGLHKQAGEGAMDFANRCIKSEPERTAEIKHITSLYVNIRYGKTSTEQELIQLSKLVAEF